MMASLNEHGKEGLQGKISQAEGYGIYPSSVGGYVIGTFEAVGTRTGAGCPAGNRGRVTGQDG